jgi:hypothetical protein
MKSLIYAAIAATVLTVPAVSFAQQSNAPVTRAQVRAELTALVNAGYDPNDTYHYPENIQAAEQRVRAEQGQTDVASAAPAAVTPVVNSSSGASLDGTSQSGRRFVPTSSVTVQPTFFGQ